MGHVLFFSCMCHISPQIYGIGECVTFIQNAFIILVQIVAPVMEVPVWIKEREEGMIPPMHVPFYLGRKPFPRNPCSTLPLGLLS